MTTTLTSNVAREGAAPEAASAVVLLGGDDIYEDLFGTTDVLAQLLTERGLATRVRVGTAALRDPAPDLLALNIAVPELSIERVDALIADVRAGMGLFALHSSAVLFDSEAEIALAALLGARFASHGPQPLESRFTVEIDPTHPLTAGLSSFEVDHEHYELELSDDAVVVAWRRTADGREPVLVVRTEGAGRVAYLQIGHDTQPLGVPAVRELIARSFDWLLDHREG